MNYYYSVRQSQGDWVATLYEICVLDGSNKGVVSNVEANSHPELMTKISEFVDKMKNNL